MGTPVSGWWWLCGGAAMFRQRGRQSRKNILSLIETVQIQQKEKEEKQGKEDGAKKKAVKTIRFRSVSVSPRDEGYTTENENQYEKFDCRKDDSDDWDVETDDETYEADLNQKTHNATNIKKNIQSNPAPVRHQTAPQAFTSRLDLVKPIL